MTWGGADVRGLLGWKWRYHLLSFVAIAAVAVTVGIIVWPEGRRPAIVANNVSRNYRACLMVTPGDPETNELVEATWRGLQSAAATGRVNAERFPVPSADIPVALPYLNGAISRHCGVVVAVGAALLPAVRAVAKNAKDQQFLVVNGDLAMPNVTTINESGADAVMKKTRSYALERAAR
jgi:hypothetical protein